MEYIKDPSERPIPTMFVDDNEVCSHSQLKEDCKLCIDETYADYLIEDAIQRKVDEQRSK